MSDRSQTVEIQLKSAQMKVFACEQRFGVLVAGRRFGKTYLALVELLRAVAKTGSKGWYVAPSYKQAKRIAWEQLKELTRMFWAERPNETDLTIKLRWGGAISVRGADRYDSLRGEGLDFVVLDEYASMDPACWKEVLRPALSDRQGGALFIGTPQGFDHLYEQYCWAEKDPEWGAFRFTTEQGGNVSGEELASAARELDERCYQQEFGASFETVGVGRAYYAFDRNENVTECEYAKDVPVIWSVDFNVNPMCSVVAQRVGETVYVLDEIVLPDGNTPKACEAFFERTEWMRKGMDARYAKTLRVNVYGDATGNRRNSAASRTDWKIVRDFFDRLDGCFDVTMRVSTANPLVKDRINCVNAKLRNAEGERRLLVDGRCKELIRDFERVCWKADGSGNAVGELDKSDGRGRT